MPGGDVYLRSYSSGLPDIVFPRPDVGVHYILIGRNPQMSMLKERVTDADGVYLVRLQDYAAVSELHVVLSICPYGYSKFHTQATTNGLSVGTLRSKAQLKIDNSHLCRPILTAGLYNLEHRRILYLGDADAPDESPCYVFDENGSL